MLARHRSLPMFVLEVRLSYPTCTVEGGQTIVETASQWLPPECSSTCTNSSLIMSNLICDSVAHFGDQALDMYSSR